MAIEIGKKNITNSSSAIDDDNDCRLFVWFGSQIIICY